MASRPSVVVIGAGVVGLSTAANIQRTVPGCRVTVVADRYTVDTTSDGAAGIFIPTMSRTNFPDVDLFRQMCVDSFSWYDNLCKCHNATETGVIKLSGYQLESEKKSIPFFRDFIYSFRELTSVELDMLPIKRRYGWFYTTLMVECRRYLPWLMKRFRDNGGEFVTRNVKSIEEFLGTCDVLVNCSGLGSKELFNDDKMYPIRGHIIRVNAPWIKHFHFVDEANTYTIPGQDNVVVGGTRQEGMRNVTEDGSEYFDDIMRRVSEIYPHITKTEVVRKWIGLRPNRTTMRVDKDVYLKNGKRLKIVHNYGHGANGVALSWGSGLHAAKLVQSSLENTDVINKSKL